MCGVELFPPVFELQNVHGSEDASRKGAVISSV